MAVSTRKGQQSKYTAATLKRLHMDSKSTRSDRQRIEKEREEFKEALKRA